MVARPRHVSVIGGGIAGLGVGYYATRRGISVALYEAESTAGGNCRTMEQEGFRFDLGAHRFHDKDAEITCDVQALLGTELRRVFRPSAICSEGRFVAFPLRPFDLVGAIGVRRSARVALELLQARARLGRPPAMSLEDVAVGAYGRHIAERFLLNYSAKLWGAPCHRLAPSVGGGRLNGLTLRAALAESLMGNRRRAAHVDGSFYYPVGGIGALADRLGQAIGEGLRTNARITGVMHDGHRVRAVEINGLTRVEVDHVVSTLPIDELLQSLTPRPPEAVLAAASTLRFRSLVLVALFLDAPRVTDRATVYFPEAQFPFTRAFEPINRSEAMAPPGKTSIVVEVPCDHGDATWTASDTTLVEAVRQPLAALGWVPRGSCRGTAVLRLRHAYPVTLVGQEETQRLLRSYLGRFENLEWIGRNASFEYTWMHVLLRQAKTLVQRWEVHS